MISIPLYTVHNLAVLLQGFVKEISDMIIHSFDRSCMHILLSGISSLIKSILAVSLRPV